MESLPLSLQQGADPGEKELVSRLDIERLEIGGYEGEHAPVDYIGAVALGGVFLRQVGTAAQDPLAGGGLFPSRTVPRLEGHDQAAQAGGGRIVAL